LAFHFTPNRRINKVGQRGEILIFPQALKSAFNFYYFKVYSNRMSKTVSCSPCRTADRLRRGGLVFVFFALAAASLLALDPRKDISQYIIDLWSTENSNIPQDSILSMIQTHDGYLWVGTYEGLARFDGLHFTVFDKSNTPEMQNNGMMVMAEGADGAIWIGTPNGLLCRRDGSFRNFTISDGLSSDFILALGRDARGALWIGTTKGLNRYEHGVFTSFTIGDGLDQGYISALCAGPDNAMWIGTSDGLFRYDSGRFLRYELPGGKPGNTVWALCAGRDKTLWIGTAGGGLIRMRDGVFHAYSSRDGLSGNDIRIICEDSHGILWIGTGSNGLNRLEKEAFSHLGHPSGLGNDSLRTLVEDAEGSLWVGTYGGGLNRLKDDRYISYNRRNGLPVDSVRSVMQDREGSVWIGTVGGGLVRFSSGTFTIFNEKQGLRDLRIWSIAQGLDGAILFGTYGGGMHRLQAGRITAVYSTRNGLANDIVRVILAARDGTVWIGTNGGGIDILHPDGHIVNYNRRSGLGDDFIYAISQDRDGAIWVGTYNGELYRFRDGKFTVYQPRSGTSQNAIWAIHPDADGSLWLATNSGGLIRFKDGKFRTIGSRDGLYSDVAFQILDDDRGYLWMNCNKGVYRVSKKELNDFADGAIRRVQSLSLGISEGVRGVESTGPAQPAGWKCRDGSLWFATIKGVTVLDPDYRKRNERVPPVLIEKMVVEGQEINIKAPVVIAPGSKKLEFTFTALSFLVPEKNRFKTMLRGFDRNWSVESSQRQVSYTNLPPGRYTFRVIACNNDGKWNESGASLVFELRPFFYQTIWFQVLVVLALLFLAVLAIRRRFRSLERHKHELEVQVRERTAQLLRVNAELLQANRVQDEMQRIAVHDLKNPLQTIMGSAELIGRHDSGPEVGGRLAEKISLASKRMLTLVNEMLEISRIETGDIELQLQAVDIGVLIAQVADGFASQVLNKGQRLDLAVEPGCLVKSDPEWLKVIFSNLISNAVKFSPRQAPIGIAVSCRGKTVLATVKDRGPGLTPDDKKKLFGKFQRLSAKPTGGETSTGLGLSIAEQLVRRHGGRIWAESEKGQGSTFCVELPRLE
jgi:ligand-binding sensor domain-containing protein/signal transduction histidine kinase